MPNRVVAPKFTVHSVVAGGKTECGSIACSFRTVFRQAVEASSCILEAASSEESGSMALLGGDKEKEVVPPPLPPRYRLRDLILGDYAFNDDGER